MVQAAQTQGGQKLTVRIFLLLFLAVCAVFHPVINGEFLHWDDDLIIATNPHIRGLNWEHLKWAFTTNTLLRYQPLVCLTWSAIYELFGLKSAAYHLVILLIHATNAGLVFLLIRKLLFVSFKPANTRSENSLLICAALAAGFWALHPLRVETTAWAVALGHDQALLFVLLALLAYLRAAQPDQSRLFYWASMFCFTCSLLSFPTALGSLVVFVVLDFYPLRRVNFNPLKWFSASARRVWLEKIPFIAITLLVGWFNLRILSTPGAQGQTASLNETGWLPQIMQAFFVWAYYVWKPFWPTRLTPMPTQLIEVNPHNPIFILSAAFVIGLTIALFLLRRRWPAALAVWVCHIALLAPFLGLSEHPHYVSDRYGLLPSIGWAILLAAIFVKLWSHPPARAIVVGSVVIALGAFGYASYRQTFVWQNSVALFHHILANLKDEPKLARHRSSIYWRLGQAEIERGRYEEAIAAYRAAIRLKPNFAEAHHSLGDALGLRGEFDAAEASYAGALRLQPALANQLSNEGVACAQQGRTDLALAHFRAVLRNDPENASALNNMAVALTSLGKTNEAQIFLRRAKAAVPKTSAP